MESYRYSALDAYRQCPTKYRISFRDAIERTKSMLWLVNGGLFHEAMEDHYKNGTDRIAAGRKAWATWFEEVAKVSAPLAAVAQFYDLWKCQRAITEPFRLRKITKPDGTPYTKPTATTAFRNLKRGSEWDALKVRADAWQEQVQGVYFRPQDKLAESFCDCLDWLADYQHPSEYGAVRESERKFFIEDPWGNTHEGTMDLVLDFQDGYAIHDFKTSRMLKESVDRDPQLCMYAYAAYKLFGEYPKQISLHFVRFGKVVKATVDRANIEHTYETFVKPIVHAIRASEATDTWIKHTPDAFQAPCPTCELFYCGLCNKEYQPKEG